MWEYSRHHYLLNYFRLSLVCKVAAPVFFSLLLTNLSITVSLVVIAVWNIVSAVVEIIVRLLDFSMLISLASS